MVAATSATGHVSHHGGGLFIFAFKHGRGIGVARVVGHFLGPGGGPSGSTLVFGDRIQSCWSLGDVAQLGEGSAALLEQLRVESRIVV